MTEVEMLLDLRERVARLENERHDDGFWTTIKEVDPDTASIVTAEGRRVPIWSMSSRLVVQPVAGDQCLVMRGVAVCGVRPNTAEDGDVDLIRDVLRHDRATGEVGLGATPSGFVAMADPTLERFNQLKNAVDGWTPVAQDGGAALKTRLTSLFTGGWPQAVAAEKVKAQ